ncbi:MAG TPA: LamG domain-containing protein, partial [Roseiflexaceae bacterium]|nr:LamG domain-containing protein [Roseiflexaceae bacterium]
AAADVGLLSPGVFGAHPPLVWQRHATLPMIQALPLTQSQSPPNYPAASRQLAPFALPIVKQTNGGVTLDLPGAWSFGVTAERAAATWPSLRSAAMPAEEWRALSDLPLAALSIPGLLLDPSATAAAQGLPGAMLPVQYRFDLPYADEINALAQLPKVPRDPSQVSPLPDEPPPTPPKPLTRETFGEHWLRLSERASLASADDATAFDRVGAQAVVRHLVEPYTWDVEASFTAAPYPGGLAIGNSADTPAPVAEDQALAGIAGLFAEANGKLTRLPDGAPANGAFQVTSGSMAAALAAPGVLRDQRGLQRHASTLAGGLLTTEVTQIAPAAQVSYQLTSTFEPCELRAGDGQAWRFWCRDLPVRGADGLFQRGTAHSPLRQDVNDPEALSSDYDYLGGYEWRIASDQLEADYPALLRLYGLLFYPLTLDEVQAREGRVERVVLTGRLQLALPTPAELTDLANPVQITFTRDGASLFLSAIQVSPERPPEDATPNQIEWPLALAGDELSGAPRLRWTSVALQGRNIVVQDPKLEFFLFDVPWTLAVKPLVFTPGGGLASPPVIETTMADEALAVAGAGLTLDLAGGQHAAFVDLLVRLGRQFLARAAGPARGAFTASVRFQLPIAQPEVQASWQSAVLFDDLSIALVPAGPRAELRYAGRSLQFAWEQLGAEVDARFQLLPGMHLLPPSAPGFAALTFEARANTGGAPSLPIATAFVEALLCARWGAFLQDDGPLTAERVFGSSAGDVALGYTAERQDGEWHESFLINGFLEVKSLISWPLELRYVESERTLTLPASRGPGAASPLRHTRHTMRVLLNQQALDSALLAPGPGQLLFQLAPNQSWQFLAVVEHQLLDLLPPAAPAADVLASGPQQRWTALQEVRVLPRTSLISFLETYGAASARGFDPASGINSLSATIDGSLRAGLRERLIDALGKLPDDTLLVEASAAHWISKRILADARPTTLQFLPGGSQHGILSGPQDYAPSAPHDPAWLLLTTPFLGRLQDAARDTAPAASAASMLQLDPIQQLQGAPAGAALDGLLLALTNRGDDADARLRIADMDSSAGRTWARLDPLTLEENWFRIGAPRPEPPADRLQSIAAALPDTPARLSRSVALRRAFDVFRASYPPADDGRYELPDEVVGTSVVWRPNSILVQQSLGDTRSARGLVALYTFAEGSGTTVNDVSGVSSPLNLKISKAASVTWLPGGGLSVSAPVVIASAADTKKIFDACALSQELTIEAWVKPASATPPTPSQPGRIVVLSKDSERRNFLLQQGTFDKPAAAHYHVRLHTDKTGDDKQPALTTPEGTLTTALQHVVYTRDAAGQARLYIDGVLQAADSRAGKLEWNNKYQLALPNEPGGDRPWLGEYYMVAIYSQALTAGEVQSNFTARSRPAVYGWHTTGLLRASALVPADRGAPAMQRHAAATLLPARLTLDVRRRDGEQTVAETRANPLPLSFAVSPYVGLAFRRAPEAAELRLLLLAAELLCLDRASGAMRPVASYIWELDHATDVEAARGFCQDWAAATQRQLAPESPVAVLRLREVYANQDLGTEQQALLTTGYRFELVAGQVAPIELSRRVARLRAEAPRLRFREGQYGGHQLPLDVRPFELAPPQTVGAQPLYLTARPTTAPDAPAAWPWGLSALRLSLRYAVRSASLPNGGTTTVDAGVVGAAGQPGQPLMLWWQAPQYRVQFRSALHSGLPAAGLPKSFRAAAVRALLPVVPNPRMPAQPIEPAEEADDQLSWWQPVLPGGLRYLIAGARPGVMFAIRNQLLRQRLGGSAGEPVLVSGSVPVQHRAPRPVPLPANAPAAAARQDVALRAWASYFAPDASLRVAAAPLDEAFFAGAVLPSVAPDATVARPARGLLLRLVSPGSGKLDSAWDGAFVFEGQSLGASSALADWRIELTAQAGGRALDCALVATGDHSLRFEPTTQAKENLRDALLARSAPGDTIELVARVAPAEARDGFRQMLVFTLRIGDEAGLPLPLEPAFIHFEDPEYNRRLVSQSAAASQLVALADADKRPQLKTITLAADRREYNPGSVLALRYDWDDPLVGVKGQLELRRVDINGIETVLVAPAPGVDGEGPGVLRQFSLLELERKLNPGAEKPPLLRPGDILQLKLVIHPNGVQVLKEYAVVLEVRIVADPVIPVPEAGYALLRRQIQNGQLQVECARFAWGPNASRIELVDANDLRTEIVRRRAVFQWQDAARPNTVLGYAIQKLTMGGSTHSVDQWVAPPADE